MKKYYNKSGLSGVGTPNIHTRMIIDFLKQTKTVFCNVCMALFLILSFSSEINGQADDPCDCNNSWTVRGTANGTIIISDMTPPVTNCTWFRGTIQINDPTTWTNLSIRMETGSRIIANAKLTIDECNIGTCDDLWRGIYVEGGSGIVVSNSILSGANIAIELEDESKYSIHDSEFVNNYIGISTGSPFDALLQGITVYPENGAILGCNFYTDSQVPDPYTGHYYFPSWPSNIAIPYNQGYAALYISGSTGLDLGELGADLAERNVIYNMRNGVIARYSTTDILGTDFENFEGSVPKPAALSGLLNFNQRGISLESSVCHIEQDTFKNVMIGVHSSLRSSQVIVDNYMNIPIQSPVAATRGIDISHGNYIYIAENKIFNGFKGIHIYSSKLGLVIKDNNLYRWLTNDNNVGINLETIHRLSLDNRVHDNVLDITGGRKAVGISMNIAYELHLVHNTVNFLQTEPLPAGTENAGISGMSVYSSRITDNIISASSHYKSREYNAGIIITNGMGNDVFCNSTHNMYYGQRFIGNNYPTDLKSNYFHDAYHGLDLLSPTTLGTQEHYGNKWLGDYTEYGAYISGHDPEGTALKSRFIADSSDGLPGELIPNEIGPFAVENLWFLDVVGEAEAAICIAYPIDDDLPLTDTLVTLIRHPYIFTDYEDEMNWMRKADMLTFLYLYPAYLSNTVLDSFFDAESTTPLGELIWAQYQMGKTHGIDPDMAETDSLVFEYSVQVRILDSLIALNPYNVVALKALRVLKIDTLAEYMNDWLGMLDNQIADTEDSIDFALNVVDNVTPTNVQETDLQAMLWLKGGHGKGDSLTTAELEGVYAFARQCPWIGARSLSEAQMLYSVIADSIFTHRPGECAKLDPFSMIEDRSDKSGFVNQVRIHPNPASDLIYLQLPDWVETLELFSLDGRLWKQIYTPNSGRYTINIKEIPSGIYYIRSQGGKKIETHQISIIQ
ncbi:MAG: T9SS type A sorting domain-containing protein [Saprospiraceae bacterium]|nr:T9SS type A sorting domain-containing protein [Candidatus Opimibacter skivensis]